MRELRFEVPDRKLVCDMRVIVVSNRMYQLILASHAGRDTSRESETFFKSFHLRTDTELESDVSRKALERGGGDTNGHELGKSRG